MTSTTLVEVSNVQLGVFFENWLVIDFVTAKVLPQKTISPLLTQNKWEPVLNPYTFWQAKALQPLPLKQLHTLSVYELKLYN